MITMNGTGARLLPKRLARGLAIASLTFWFAGITSAQKITSLQTTAKGQGTINISDIDKHKLTSVLVILKENGDAELTFYADLQLSAKGTWSVGKSQGIDLKITGGIVSGGGNGTGKLLLRKDGKSIKKLTIDGTSADGSKISVDFTASTPTSKSQ
jgi:hypothetical protein